MAFRANKRGANFRPIFPSPTAGDGKIRENNARPGKEQPDARPSPRRKVKCRICGFPADLSRHDNSGGNLEGDGAGGLISTSESDATMKEQAYRTGAGCPHCFSKNFSNQKQ